MLDINTQTVMVTGATGFIGRNLVKKLLEKNFKVIVLVRDVKRFNLIFNSKSVRVIHFDIDNPLYDFKFPVDATLIHCAWSNVRSTTSMSHIENCALNQYHFIRRMIDLGLKNIIVTGSCYEYGVQYGALSADAITNPNTQYGLAKDFLRKSLMMLRNEIDFNLIWARLFYVYGDDQSDGSIMSEFDKALQDRALVFNMSYGEQLYDYLPIEKVVEYMIELINYKNGIINVCSGQPISIRRLLENRMVDKGVRISLNTGYYNYRNQDSLAIWGRKSFRDQIVDIC